MSNDNNDLVDSWFTPEEHAKWTQMVAAQEAQQAQLDAIVEAGITSRVATVEHEDGESIEDLASRLILKASEVGKAIAIIHKDGVLLIAVRDETTVADLVAHWEAHKTADIPTLNDYFRQIDSDTVLPPAPLLDQMVATNTVRARQAEDTDATL